MTFDTLGLSHWFLTDNYRAKAHIKYELKYLESYLHRSLNTSAPPANEIHSLCDRLAKKYVEYLKLINCRNNFDLSDLNIPVQKDKKDKYYPSIVQLKHKLSLVADVEEESRLVEMIASLYYQWAKCLNESSLPNPEVTHHLEKLFQTDDLKCWLSSLVTYWNQQKNEDNTLAFMNWDRQRLHTALVFLSQPELVSLINTIFFYKLYPDQLFKELIHPEKLVSIRTRLKCLHDIIEKLQQQLYRQAHQQGLKVTIDLLFHGDELPHGIKLEINEDFTDAIQEAVKHLKVKCSADSEEQITIERLHEIIRAYKYWFNPNRLIDAVMVLQQRLVKNISADMDALFIFHQEMFVLYRQLSTTECLDLYGYFTNKDSRYLLYILLTIVQGKYLEWLPKLGNAEKKAIEKVFNALQCVMEALRDELKSRHITTDAYRYDLAKQQVCAGRRNRNAVLRLIAIYGDTSVCISESVEKLFRYIEVQNPE